MLTEYEQLQIIKMVEAKTLSADEAMQLLKRLEEENQSTGQGPVNQNKTPIRLSKVSVTMKNNQ